ncbi:MAG: AcrB/AcrD/AcrF family protein [Calditrichaeota bacterium]|nr:MAG: AcrB/AcrD/AcrF family protein [Calditrichota bacterium]
MKITDISLKSVTSIFVLLFIIVVAGLKTYSGLPVENFPDIKQPVVIVAAPYVGVSPSDMETLVTQPLEEKISEITKIKKLSSSTSEGYTNITVEFEPDIDIDDAVRKVREKVDQAKQDLPSDLEDPIIQEVNFENIPIMYISITGNQTLVKLKELAEDLEDKFKQVSGVLDVNITGGLEREVKINVSPSRLQAYNIGIEDVTIAIQNENVTIPGGSLESGNLKYTVRVPGEFTSIQDIENVVVKQKSGSPIYLKDVANVFFGFKERENFARLNGSSSVTVSIQKRSGENLIRIADSIKEIMEKESKHFPEGTVYTILGDQSKDIRIMVNDLENNIIAGMLLVIGVLYFFFGLRNGLLVGIAIPLSMLISFIAMGMLGYTLNMIVLFSLILALGMLVDNAIVIIENIYRHHTEEGKPLFQAASEATKEVGVAVVVSTITTLAAFAPMIFWPGMVGEFMSYLPITLIITLSASLFVGLVINPVLSAMFIKKQKEDKVLIGDVLIQKLAILYDGSLKWALNHRKTTILFTVVAYIFVFMIYGMFNAGVEFFPDLEPKQIFVNVEAPVGTHLDASNEIVKEIESKIKDTPDMDNFIVDVGVSNNGGFDFGVGGGSSHTSTVTIDLFDKFKRVQNSFLTLDGVKEKISGIPGARVDVSKPPEGPPTGAAVEIQIKGNDFNILDDISNKIQRKIENVEGLAELKDNYNKGRPELRIRVDREKAALFGLNTMQIANSIRTAVNGFEASEYRLGQDQHEITVRFDKNYRENYSDILELTVFHEGTHFPLANFATIELSSGLSQVNHVDEDRVVIVTADAIGRSSSEIMVEVKELLNGFEVPEGYTLNYAGQDKEQKEAEEFLTNAFLVALGLIFFALVSQFNSVTIPFIIMISVLLSFIGVFFGLLVTDKPFGIIMTGIGVISLAGIVVNNAIVLIDYIQKLREQGMEKVDAIILGGKTRLRPVILTAITTILGLIPLTAGINIDFIGLFKGDVSKFIEFGADSSQWWGNMGVAVIFGLMFATFLTLIVVPVLYYYLSDLFSGKKEEVKI